MLFLLKTHWSTAYLGLAVLTLLGIPLRFAGFYGAWAEGATLELTSKALLLGIGVAAIIGLSDGLLHGLSLLLFGPAYRRRFQQLAGLFHEQNFAATLTGSLMAGVGEELVFRGLSLSPYYLFGGAIVFGLLHHVCCDLWPFTLWAVWEGILFATALYFTELLAVTMIAHFLHDLIGFLIFRVVNRAGPTPPAAAFSN